MSRTAAQDAVACSHYLADLRGGEDMHRFNAAVDDFLVRHKDKGLSVGTLRHILANEYITLTPDDPAGRQLILGPKP